MSRLQARLLSAACVSSLVAAMTAIDESFRGFLAGLVNVEPSAALSFSSVSVHHVGRTILDMMPIQLTGQAPLVFFAVTGGALVVLMFRT